MASKQALRLFFAAMLATMATSTMAAKGFEYSYLDIGYEYTDFKDSDDGSSLKLAVVKASFSTFDHVALRAAFKRGKLDGFPSENGTNDPDFTEAQAGAWGHYGLIKKKLDVFAGANWFYNSRNSSSNSVSSVSDAGAIVDAGFRYAAFKWLEMEAGGEYRSGDYNDTTAFISPRLKVTKNLWMNFKTNQFGDNDTYFAGLRWDF